METPTWLNSRYRWKITQEKKADEHAAFTYWFRFIIPVHMIVNLSVFQYTGEFGLIDVSWRSLAVGAITSILVLPINFLITLLFRRSKVSVMCILADVHHFMKVCHLTAKWMECQFSFVNCERKPPLMNVIRMGHSVTVYFWFMFTIFCLE